MMNTLVYFIEGIQVNNRTFVSPESLLSLFTLKCCKNNITIVFVNKFNKTLQDDILLDSKKIWLRIPLDFSFQYRFEYINECPVMVQNCSLPAVYIEKEKYCIVGLSSSIRYILSQNANESDIHKRLLGFRGGCLQACAEVSTWTKFCEIEIVETIKKFYNENNENTNFTELEQFKFPINLIRYERHLEQPPIMHNALKRKQENLAKISDKINYFNLKNKKLKELPNLDHIYAEGIDLTLADIFLYTAFSLILYKISNINNLSNICPLVLKWHSLIENKEFIIENKNFFSCIKEDHFPLSLPKDCSLFIPELTSESLYKSDPQRYKSRWRMFTNQCDIIAVLNKLDHVTFSSGILECTKHNFISNDLVSECIKSFNGLSINENYTALNLIFKDMIEWNSLPPAVHPIEGQLPLNRLKRKCEQLESMFHVVMSIASDGDVIVDFCSGGGHLGILLAFYLPSCTILLVENKKISLDKAFNRVKSINLNNVKFYQCNLDYFEGVFDIGICLHACGSATDLVIEKCIIQSASFICCPCCYGSVKPNHILSYPRSSIFNDKYKISLNEYLILAHTADQTHDIDNPKTIQGKLCMKYVDYDRLFLAHSYGYKVALAVMNPPECTPKNHILLGICKNK